MSNVLQYLGAISLALNVLFVLFVLVARTWITEKIRARIQSAYAERLETLKIQLKADSDFEIERFKSQANSEIERLKSELSIVAAERHVRFTRLHDKRAEVIAEIYKLVAATHTAVELFVAEDVPFDVVDLPPWKERAESAEKAISALRNYFVPHAIFVPKPVSDIIVELSKQYGTGYWVGLIGYGAPSETEKLDHLKLATEKITALTHTALVDLERRFRMLLGDELEKTD
jgi:hypothetical protein